MFIRSQNNFSLINMDLNNIRIEDGDDIKGVTRRIFSGHELLGRYDTVDRAIEVLDEIEKEYCAPSLSNVPHVFQMPED